MDWINFLADGGVAVARAIPSALGNLVETIVDPQGGHFLATAFVKAPGEHPWLVGWTPGRYVIYGQLLGKMHTLAEDYQPTNPAWKRPEWDDDSMEFVERYLPPSESIAKQKYRAVCEHLQQPPPDPRKTNPDIPIQASNAILRALAKRPDDRYPSAQAMMAALQ